MKTINRLYALLNWKLAWFTHPYNIIVKEYWKEQYFNFKYINK